MIEALDLLLKVLDSNLLFHHGNLESWDCNSVPLLVNPELCNWNFNSALEVDIHKLIFFPTHSPRARHCVPRAYLHNSLWCLKIVEVEDATSLG